jgi:hypothetical protein
VEDRAGQAIAEARFKRLGTSVAPDATFTLRLSYGEVRGWLDGNATLRHFTDIAGAFARHTGADPYALPASWLTGQDQIDTRKRAEFCDDQRHHWRQFRRSGYQPQWKSSV